MRVFDMEQRTDEWYQARAGVITASQFGLVQKPKTRAGSMTAEAKNYITRLALERISGDAMRFDEYVSEAMERGRRLEDEALGIYELGSDSDLRVQRVGFIKSSDSMIGCSPDGLVGDDGGVEIKCPVSLRVLTKILTDEDFSDYTPQVYGAMWITGREWWDLAFYIPQLRDDNAFRVHRFQRDEAIIADLARAVHAFDDLVEEQVEKLGGRVTGGQEEGTNH